MYRFTLNTTGGNYGKKVDNSVLANNCKEQQFELHYFGGKIGGKFEGPTGGNSGAPFKIDFFDRITVFQSIILF